MPDQTKARRFEDFARMRLEGRSDITYRAYDLLTKERPGANIVAYLVAAGQHVPRNMAQSALGVLQQRFIMWGFSTLGYGEIENLLHEFWVYQRIRFNGKRNWPCRDPDESRRLYEQNEALKLT